jgi:hypothetical protein
MMLGLALLHPGERSSRTFRDATRRMGDPLAISDVVAKLRSIYIHEGQTFQSDILRPCR